jgi:hypothetical protein
MHTLGRVSRNTLLNIVQPIDSVLHSAFYVYFIVFLRIYSFGKSEKKAHRLIV